MSPCIWLAAQPSNGRCFGIRARACSRIEVGNDAQRPGVQWTGLRGRQRQDGWRRLVFVTGAERARFALEGVRFMIVGKCSRTMSPLGRNDHLLAGNGIGSKFWEIGHQTNIEHRTRNVASTAPSAFEFLARYSLFCVVCYASSMQRSRLPAFRAPRLRSRRPFTRRSFAWFARWSVDRGQHIVGRCGPTTSLGASPWRPVVPKRRGDFGKYHRRGPAPIRKRMC